MSKIFDALKKTEGEIAKLTIGVIGEEVSATEATSLKNRTAHVAGDESQSSRPSAKPLGPPVASGRQAASPVPSSEETLGLAVNGSSEELRTVQQPPVNRHSNVRQAAGQKELERDHRSLHELPAEAAASLVGNRLASPLKLDPATPGSKSVVIRLRAGAPLFPFDTGDADKAAEEYRRIRTKILQHHLHPHLMLVSSPSAGDGKSITALNIAGALALNRDARVLLVDMDLRRPTIAALLGVPETEGVAEILAGSCELEDAVVRLEPFPNLFLLPAGRDRKNPAELLTSPQWKTLCAQFRSLMTYTILDGPPVDAVAEYSLLEELSDGLVLVVRKDHTVRSLLFGAVSAIPRQKLLGTVINSYRESPFWKQPSDYHYYY
jgi:capsular exopolysaccharide synthesis family protein